MVYQDPENRRGRFAGSPNVFGKILGGLSAKICPCPNVFGPKLGSVCQTRPGEPLAPIIRGPGISYFHIDNVLLENANLKSHEGNKQMGKNHEHHSVRGSPPSIVVDTDKPPINPSNKIRRLQYCSPVASLLVT